MLVAPIRQRGIIVEGGEGSKDAGVGEKEVKNQLDIEGPITGVVKDEYCINFERIGVGRARVLDWALKGTAIGSIVVGVGEWHEVGMCGYEVCRGKNMVEAVAAWRVNELGNECLCNGA